MIALLGVLCWLVVPSVVIVVAFLLGAAWEAGHAARRRRAHMSGRVVLEMPTVQVGDEVRRALARERIREARARQAARQ